MFELGFTQLGIVGGAILAIGLYTMAEQNKFVGLWVSFVGFVIVAGGVAVHIHKVLAESERGPEIEKTDPPKPDSPDRPWVSLEVEIAGPLAYDNVGWDAGTRWHIPIKFKLTNT